jgi:NAD(P)-dependent dehydrogenase (short-subunit alcohol dehydrogenase family)
MVAGYPGLEGRVVLVTGGTGALGSAVARAFHRSGSRVAVAARGASEAGGPYDVVQADLSDPAQAGRAVDGVVGRFGRLDVLVHCVGGYSEAPLPETSPEAWRRLVDANLSTAFYCLRAAMPHMKRQGFGRIVTVASRYALAGDAGLAAYSASKGGLLRLTEVAAAEGRDHGVTVNAILPSIIDTEANRREMPEADFTRWVPAEAIARVVLFLASDDAAVVSGASIPVYGRA